MQYLNNKQYYIIIRRNLIVFGSVVYMIKSNIKKEFNCDRDKLWNIITDNSNYLWRSDLSKIDVIDDTHFIEYTKNNYPTYFTITLKEKLKEYRFDLENTNLRGKWIGIFTELPNGNTLLDFTEEIEVNNFIMKLLARVYLKNQQKRYIIDLEKELNKTNYNL